MKRITLFLSLLFLFSLTASAQYQSDIILTSPNGVWTDSRAFSTLNAAITAVGSNERTIVIASPQVVTALTVPSTVTLEFRKNGSITNSGQLTLQTKNIIAPNRQIFTGAGDIDFASGSILKTGWFSSFEESADVTSDDTVTLIVSKPQTTTTSVALGNNVILKWESPGNILTADTGDTISNIKSIDAGDYQTLAGAGTFTFVDGINLNLRWFNSLRSAITWISTTIATLHIPPAYVVDLNDTIPSNIITDFIKFNGYFSVNPGVTLTFSDTSKPVSPRWFGATGDGTTDDTAAINNAIASTDGWVVFEPGRTYIVTLSVDPQDGTKYRVFPIKSHMHLDGSKATIKLKDNESTLVSPKHFNIFRYIFTVPVTDIHVKDLTIDINGDNNRIGQSLPIPANSPAYNCAAFYIYTTVTGSENILFENCRFLNNPGANSIISVSGGVTVRNCYFSEQGTDTWDHASVYLNGDDNRIEDCTFVNAATFGNAAGTSHFSAEMHGKRQIYRGNSVTHYMGGLIIAPYATPGTLANDYLMTGNTLRVSYTGVTVWRNDAGLGELADILISNNAIDLLNEDNGWDAPGWDVPATGIKVAPYYDVSNVTVVGNKITARNGFDYQKTGVWIYCQASGGTVKNVNVVANDISDVTRGIHYYQENLKGRVNNVSIIGNFVHNFAVNTESTILTPAYGILTSSTVATTYPVIITGNVIDNTESAEAADVGIGTSANLSGMISFGNSFAGVTTETAGFNYASGAAATVRWNVNLNQLVLLTDNCVFTFDAPPKLSHLTLTLLQDATGSRTVTWPASVLWPNSVAPILSTGASAYDVFTFMYDGTYYHGVARSLKTAPMLMGNTYPAIDNTYYLGKNDDDTPFSWRGIVFTDQTNGKKYRLELNAGVVTIVDLTD